MSDTTSYVAGTTDLPLFEDTIGAMLDRAVSRWPEREALVSVEQGVRWTYEEFGHRVDELARGLMSLGLERGDRTAGPAHSKRSG